MTSTITISIITFLIKFFIIFLLLFLILFLIIKAASSKTDEHKTQINIVKRKDQIDKFKRQLFKHTHNKQAKKVYIKQLKKEKKAKKYSSTISPRIYVLNFEGDILAKQTNNFKKEVSLINSIIKKTDQIMVRINSRGGSVIGYGQAAAEFARLKSSGSKVIASIDQVAASGGYLMAVVADQIIAAPFAIVGSIGVAAEVPNLHNFLKNKGIDYHVHTSGKYKRTISVLGKNTKEGIEQFEKDLRTTHQLFKKYVKQYRAKIVLDKVSTGQWWYASNSLKLGLVDKILTSEQYLSEMSKKYEILEVSFQQKKPISEKISMGIAKTFQTVGQVIKNLPREI